MSKIKIPLNNIKCNLLDLFHDYLDKSSKRSHRHRMSYEDYWDDDELRYYMEMGYIFPGCEDDFYSHYDDDDDGDVVFPPTDKGGKKHKKKGKNCRRSEMSDDDAYDLFWANQEAKLKKKHKKGNSRKSKIIDINVPYSGEEESPNEESDSYDEVDSKMIYYYPNYNIKDDRYEFTSLKEFDDFCQECGFHVAPTVAEDIAYRSVSHVCLSPLSREHGLLEIIGEESFAEMMYEAAQECGEFYG